MLLITNYTSIICKTYPLVNICTVKKPLKFMKIFSRAPARRNAPPRERSRRRGRPAAGTVTPQGQTRRGNGHAAGADPPRGAQSCERHKSRAQRRGRRSVSCRPQRCFPARGQAPYGQEKRSGSTRSPFIHTIRRFYAFARSSCAARNRRMPPEKMVERISQIAASAMST